MGQETAPRLWTHPGRRAPAAAQASGSRGARSRRSRPWLRYGQRCRERGRRLLAVELLDPRARRAGQHARLLPDGDELGLTSSPTSILLASMSADPASCLPGLTLTSSSSKCSADRGTAEGQGQVEPAPRRWKRLARPSEDDDARAYPVPSGTATSTEECPAASSTISHGRRARRPDEAIRLNWPAGRDRHPHHPSFLAVTRPHPPAHRSHSLLARPAMSAHSFPPASFFGSAPPPGFDPASLLQGLAQSDLPSFIHDVLANLATAAAAGAAAAASSPSPQAAAQGDTVISSDGPSSSSTSAAAASKAAASDASIEASSSSSSARRPRCVPLFSLRDFSFDCLSLTLFPSRIPSRIQTGPLDDRDLADDDGCA